MKSRKSFLEAGALMRGAAAMALLAGASAAFAAPGPAAFPERMPGLIEACLTAAMEEGHVSETDDSHKYMCTGEAAERMWAFLEKARVKPYEQDVGDEGVWLSRDFPLGGCYKRLRLADGSRTQEGLSCSIWIPRPARAD